MEEKNYFLIDFDSTFVTVEALDELAKLALEKNPQKEKIISQIEETTALGMEGKIPFSTSLQKRLGLFKANKGDIQKLVKLLKKSVTPSIARNKSFFKKFNDRIYIISGGFKDYLTPVLTDFGIKKNNILANEFIFDNAGNVTGFNKKNPLSKNNGKQKAVKTLNLDGKVHVIGDGFTDYQIKNDGLADKFFAFIENVQREQAVKNADHVLSSFDEFLYLQNLPRSFSFPKSRIKILALENIHSAALENFKKEGYRVEFLSKALSETNLKEKIKDATIVCIRSKTEITKEVLKSAKKLLAVGAFSVGVNQVDLDACSKEGVVVFNAPYSNTRSVVELVIGNLLMLSRKALDKSNKLHQGIWDKSSTNCHEVRGKTLGIIGYGNIGSQLSVLAENLGMDVIFYDVAEKLSLGNAKKCNTLQELLKKADFITVHIDGRKSNYNFLSQKQFNLMKNGVIFLNLSRGFVVDLEALAQNIKSGKVAGAAIDVYPKEPESNDQKFVNPLQNLSNVILTPHIGGSTEEAQKAIGMFVSEKLVNFINSGATTLSVNFPTLSLPPFKGAHRLIHVHRNVPGVLAKINNIFAQNNINIIGQYLGTNPEIGYVITDVNRQYDSKVIKQLTEVEETIKFRVLY